MYLLGNSDRKVVEEKVKGIIGKGKSGKKSKKPITGKAVIKVLEETEFSFKEMAVIRAILRLMKKGTLELKTDDIKKNSFTPAGLNKRFKDELGEEIYIKDVASGLRKLAEIGVLTKTLQITPKGKEDRGRLAYRFNENILDEKEDIISTLRGKSDEMSNIQALFSDQEMKEKSTGALNRFRGLIITPMRDDIYRIFLEYSFFQKDYFIAQEIIDKLKDEDGYRYDRTAVAGFLNMLSDETGILGRATMPVSKKGGRVNIYKLNTHLELKEVGSLKMMMREKLNLEQYETAKKKNLVMDDSGGINPFYYLFISTVMVCAAALFYLFAPLEVLAIDGAATLSKLVQWFFSAGFAPWLIVGASVIGIERFRQQSENMISRTNSVPSYPKKDKFSALLKKEFNINLDKLGISDAQKEALRMKLEQNRMLDYTDLFEIGVCPECGSKRIEKDNEYAEFVCTKCGLTAEMPLMPIIAHTPRISDENNKLVLPEAPTRANFSNDIKLVTYFAYKDPLIIGNLNVILAFVRNGENISDIIDNVKKNLSKEQIKKYTNMSEDKRKKIITGFRKDAYKELRNIAANRAKTDSSLLSEIEIYVQTKGVKLPPFGISLLARDYPIIYKSVIDRYLKIEAYAKTKGLELSESDIFLLARAYGSAYKEVIDSGLRIKEKIKREFGIETTDYYCLRIRMKNEKWQEMPNELFKDELHFRDKIVNIEQCSRVSDLIFGRNISEYEMNTVIWELSKKGKDATYGRLKRVCEIETYAEQKGLNLSISSIASLCEANVNYKKKLESVVEMKERIRNELLPEISPEISDDDCLKIIESDRYRRKSSNERLPEEILRIKSKNNKESESPRQKISFMPAACIYDEEEFEKIEALYSGKKKLSESKEEIEEIIKSTIDSKGDKKLLFELYRQNPEEIIKIAKRLRGTGVLVKEIATLIYDIRQGNLDNLRGINPPRYPAILTTMICATAILYLFVLPESQYSHQQFYLWLSFVGFAPWLIVGASVIGIERFSQQWQPRYNERGISIKVLSPNNAGDTFSPNLKKASKNRAEEADYAFNTLAEMFKQGVSDKEAHRFFKSFEKLAEDVIKDIKEKGVIVKAKNVERAFARMCESRVGSPSLEQLERLTMYDMLGIKFAYAHCPTVFIMPNVEKLRELGLPISSSTIAFSPEKREQYLEHYFDFKERDVISKCLQKIIKYGKECVEYNRLSALMKYYPDKFRAELVEVVEKNNQFLLDEIEKNYADIYAEMVKVKKGSGELEQELIKKPISFVSNDFLVWQEVLKEPGTPKIIKKFLSEKKLDKGEIKLLEEVFRKLFNIPQTYYAEILVRTAIGWSASSIIDDIGCGKRTVRSVRNVLMDRGLFAIVNGIKGEVGRKVYKITFSNELKKNFKRFAPETDKADSLLAENKAEISILLILAMFLSIMDLLFIELGKINPSFPKDNSDIFAIESQSKKKIKWNNMNNLCIHFVRHLGNWYDYDSPLIDPTHSSIISAFRRYEAIAVKFINSDKTQYYRTDHKRYLAINPSIQAAMIYANKDNRNYEIISIHPFKFEKGVRRIEKRFERCKSDFENNLAGGVSFSEITNNNEEFEKSIAPALFGMLVDKYWEILTKIEKNHSPESSTWKFRVLNKQIDLYKEAIRNCLPLVQEKDMRNAIRKINGLFLVENDHPIVFNSGLLQLSAELKNEHLLFLEELLRKKNLESCAKSLELLREKEEQFISSKNVVLNSAEDTKKEQRRLIEIFENWQPNIRIEDVKIKNFESCDYQERQSFKRYAKEDILQGRVKNLKAWGAFKDGNLLGFIIADVSEGKISSIFVKKECWNNGVGRTLLRESLLEFAKRGVKNVQSTAMLKNSYLKWWFLLKKERKFIKKHIDGWYALKFELTPENAAVIAGFKKPQGERTSEFYSLPVHLPMHWLEKRLKKVFRNGLFRHKNILQEVSDSVIINGCV